jgi:hypothetical protein
MWLRLALLASLASGAASPLAVAQPLQQYRVPHTAYGHPDIQGVWKTEFLTMLERPDGIGDLVVSADRAEALVKAIRSRIPTVVDPQVQLDDISQLAMVKGEYRSSMIVDPKDGRIPFTQTGLDLVVRIRARDTQAFDHPEQRPLAERCLENMGYPPIRALPVVLPRHIFQTRDHVVIVPEDVPGPRIIHLRSEPRPDSLRSLDGYSAGRWEGDTLVVETTHLRTEDPARGGLGRPILMSPHTKITERFTRVSDTELFYQFTVDDPELYAQTWTGEFSMTRHNGPIYEYACHEGNYSLANILRSGQAGAARRAATPAASR